MLSSEIRRQIISASIHLVDAAKQTIECVLPISHVRPCQRDPHLRAHRYAGRLGGMKALPSKRSRTSRTAGSASGFFVMPALYAKTTSHSHSIVAGGLLLMS